MIELKKGKCIYCEVCSKHCLMRSDVHQMVQKGIIENIKCILRGTCINVCLERAIGYSFCKR